MNAIGPKRTSERMVRIAIAAYFALIFALIVDGIWVAIAAKHPYVLGDWEINYAGGFVRRGLLGEAARFVNLVLGIDFKTTVFAIQVLAYASFFVFSLPVVSAAVTRYPVFAFAVLSPLTFSFAAAGPEGGGRKEIVYLATLAFIAWQLRRSASYSGLWIALLSGALCALVLTHEMLIMFVPFALLLVMIASAEVPHRRSIVLAGVPAAMALLLSVAFHGDATRIPAICASLGSSAPATCESVGAIAYLGIGLPQNIRATYHAFLQWPQTLVVAAIVFGLGVLPFLLLVANRAAVARLRGTLRKRAVTPLAMLALVMPLPLFLFSDWGRWLHIIATSWTITAAFALGHPAGAGGEVNMQPTRWPQWSGVGGLLFAIILFTYAVTWNMSGVCCPEQLGSGLLGRALSSQRASH